MITLTDEQAQQIEEALHRGVKDLEPFDRWKEQLDAIAILREALATIRAAIAEQQTERTQDAERNVVGLAEQAEKEPFKMICPRCKVDRVTTQCPNRGGIGDCPMTATAQSAVPVEQAEQEPVGYFAYDEEHDIWEELTGPNAPGATPLYAAPIRTKDLTDDEIMKINVDTASIVPTCDRQFHFARAVIAADREKNK